MLSINDRSFTYMGSMLRAMTVDHLKCNPFVGDVHRVNFVTDESVTVSETDGKWEMYLDLLAVDLWADNVAIQALAEVLHINISVLSTISQKFVNVCPIDNDVDASWIVTVGLIAERHYVPLKYRGNNEHLQNIVNISDDDFTDKETISEEVFEKGDEYSRKITGGSQISSTLTVDNPESQMHSIAPAEGERPLSIVNDPTFELMCNPEKFPYGEGCFNTSRSKRLTQKKYFQQRILDVDGRFSSDLDYIFTAQYIVESKQIFADASHYVWRQKPSVRLTAQQAKDSETILSHVRQDKAYSFLKNLRGSPPYYQKTFYELLAMIRQLGAPTWFFTLSAADMHWPDMIRTIAKQYGVSYTDEEVAALSFEERSKWLRQNPVTATRHFQYRLDIFSNSF